MADNGQEPVCENSPTHLVKDETGPALSHSSDEKAQEGTQTDRASRLRARRAARSLSEENERLSAELAEARAALLAQREPVSRSALHEAPVPNDGVGPQKPANSSFASGATVSGHGPHAFAQSQQSNEQAWPEEAVDPGPGDRGLDEKPKFFPHDGNMAHKSGIQSLIARLVDAQTAFLTNQQKFLTNQTMQSVEIPKFSGNGPPTFEDWLDRVTSIKGGRKWSADRMYGNVKLSLMDPAFSAVANDPGATDSYDKLLKFLRKAYGVRSPKV